MRKYRATQTVAFYSGVLGLTKEQAGCRGRCLEKVGKDRYAVLALVEFKAGEVMGLEEVPKPYAGVLTPFLTEAEQARIKAEADARDKAAAEEKAAQQAAKAEAQAKEKAKAEAEAKAKAEADAKAGK